MPVAGWLGGLLNPLSPRLKDLPVTLLQIPMPMMRMPITTNAFSSTVPPGTWKPERSGMLTLIGFDGAVASGPVVVEAFGCPCSSLLTDDESLEPWPALAALTAP